MPWARPIGSDSMRATTAPHVPMMSGDQKRLRSMHGSVLGDPSFAKHGLGGDFAQRIQSWPASEM
jgi:hypothetical protein